MISVFINNAGPYILLGDKAGDGYSTYVSPDNRSPIFALDAARGIELRALVADLVDDLALREAAEALIDGTATGMSTAIPGIAGLTEIQRFQNHFILVAADHVSRLHITDAEVVAIFRGIEYISASGV